MLKDELLSLHISQSFVGWIFRSISGMRHQRQIGPFDRLCFVEQVMVLNQLPMSKTSA
jgi:hypothetical protein